MADNLAEPKSRELALHLRYFLLNLGGHPVLCSASPYGLSARQETFLLLSASYLLLGIVFVIGFRLAGCPPARAAWPGMRAVLGALARQGFLLLIMANLLLMLGLCPVRAALIQYLTCAGTPEVERLIGCGDDQRADHSDAAVPLLHLTAAGHLKGTISGRPLHLRTRGGHGGLAGRLGVGPLGRGAGFYAPMALLCLVILMLLWSEYPDSQALR